MSIPWQINFWPWNKVEAWMWRSCPPGVPEKKPGSATTFVWFGLIRFFLLIALCPIKGRVWFCLSVWHKIFVCVVLYFLYDFFPRFPFQTKTDRSGASLGLTPHSFEESFFALFAFLLLFLTAVHDYDRKKDNQHVFPWDAAAADVVGDAEEL